MTKTHGDNMMRRLVTAVVLAALAAGCATHTSRPGAQPSPHTSRPAPQPSTAARDPSTTAALLKIATVFNNDYDNGIYWPVYDRWDARSQAIISRAGYMGRHPECPSARQVAHVEDARQGHGW
jgi:hypothetical protein